LLEFFADTRDRSRLRRKNNVGHDGALISSRAFALRVGEQSFIEIRTVDLIGVLCCYS